MGERIPPTERQPGPDGERDEAQTAAADPAATLVPSLAPEDAPQLLEGLLRYIPEGITIAAAPDVRIVATSDYTETVTGRGPGELLGGAADALVSRWQVLRPDGVTVPASEELPIVRATRGGEVVLNETWLLRRPDGGTRRVLCNAGPIRDAGGAIRYGVVAWRDVTELHDAQAEVELERQKVLALQATRLQEANHRIKNSLMLAASILRLQGRSAAAEVRAELDEAAGRIAALGAVYDHLLVEGDGDHVEIGGYLVALARSMVLAADTARRPFSIEVDAARWTVAASTAIHVGLLAHELVTNAYKHAVGADGACRVDLRFAVAGGVATLEVTDTGPGPPEGFDPATAPGVGMRLVRSLVEQVGGTLRLARTADGTCFAVSFPS